MSGKFMVNTHPFIHVHSTVDSGETFGIMGWNLVLPPHGEEYDWETDGLVAEPDKGCVAFVSASGRPCHKPGIVCLAVTTWKAGHFGRFHLCGSHLAQHRNGREVRLAL